MFKPYPDPQRMNVDLHTHTCASDGTLSPVDLVTRAHANGVQWLAITDHDDLTSIAPARAAAAALGIGFVAGVEISVTFYDKSVHIVGLGIDETNSELVAGLTGVRAGRDARAERMAASLEKAGIHGALAGARAYATNPDLVSRTHFARFLVQAGVCDTTSDVFHHYLTEGKPGFVHHDWATLRDALRWIQAAGGVAVIAHPGRYRFNATQRFALLSEFKDLGGAALEVVTGSHTIPQYTEYAKLCTEFGFAASRGSDFHSPTESRVDVGCLPELPASCVPVWHSCEGLLAR